MKVNGQLSQTCYLRALDSCYDRLAAKKTAAAEAAAEAAPERAEGGGGGGGGKGRPFVLSDVHHVLCHSPYNKLVQKSFARMAFSDARRLRVQGKPLGEGQAEALGKWLDVPAEVCVVCVEAVRGSTVSVCSHVVLPLLRWLWPGIECFFLKTLTCMLWYDNADSSHGNQVPVDCLN